MNKDEILVPILTAINDLREEVRENRRAIKKNSEEILKNREAIKKNSEEILKNREAIKENSEKIQRNTELIKKNSEKIDHNSNSIVSLEERLERHEEESKKDRRAILDILYSYEQVTDKQYKENKSRIEKLEEKFAVISA